MLSCSLSHAGPEDPRKEGNRSIEGTHKRSDLPLPSLPLHHIHHRSIVHTRPLCSFHLGSVLALGDLRVDGRGQETFQHFWDLHRPVRACASGREGREGGSGRAQAAQDRGGGQHGVVGEGDEEGEERRLQVDDELFLICFLNGLEVRTTASLVRFIVR